MSTPKKALLLLVSLLLASLSFADEAPNALSSATFAGVSDGAEPGAPWKVRARGTDTAVLKKVPEGSESGNWIYVVDRDPSEKVYLVTDIPAMAKGTLSFKIHYAGPDATVGIYLRSPDLPKSSDAVVEFKTLEGSGSIYVGAHGKRTKLPVSIAGHGTMEFSIDFESTEAGEMLKVFIVEGDARNLVHRETVPGGGVPQSIMITTDTKTAASEFYVGDVTLVERS